MLVQARTPVLRLSTMTYGTVEKKTPTTPLPRATRGARVPVTMDVRKGHPVERRRGLMRVLVVRRRVQLGAFT
jgi:hypothetical protein